MLPEGEAVLVCYIDEGLYRKAKKTAETRGRTLRAVIEEALLGYIENCEESELMRRVFGGEREWLKEGKN